MVLLVSPRLTVAHISKIKPTKQEYLLRHWSAASVRAPPFRHWSAASVRAPPLNLERHLGACSVRWDCIFKTIKNQTQYARMLASALERCCGPCSAVSALERCLGPCSAVRTWNITAVYVPFVGIGFSKLGGTPPWCAFPFGCLTRTVSIASARARPDLSRDRFGNEVQEAPEP